MPCYAPSEFVDTQVASSFGTLAETIIGADYLRDVGRIPVFPLSHQDFFDFSEGFGNTALYIAFLKLNHPRLSVSQLAELSASANVKIPDIMTYDPPGRTEFYEIKPDSGTGRSAGTVKIAQIDALMGRFSLPYVPGAQYSPLNKKIRFFSGTALGVDIKLYLEFSRISPGLIVYKVCIEGEDWVPVAVLLAVAAIILIIITRGRILRGAPRPLPIPVPALG